MLKSLFLMVMSQRITINHHRNPDPSLEITINHHRTPQVLEDFLPPFSRSPGAGALQGSARGEVGHGAGAAGGRVPAGEVDLEDGESQGKRRPAERAQGPKGATETSTTRPPL